MASVDIAEKKSKSLEGAEVVEVVAVDVAAVLKPISAPAESWPEPIESGFFGVSITDRHIRS